MHQRFINKISCWNFLWWYIYINVHRFPKKIEVSYFFTFTSFITYQQALCFKRALRLDFDHNQAWIKKHDKVGGKWAEKKTAVSKLDWWGWAVWNQLNRTFIYTLKIAKFSILRIFDLTIIKVPEVLFSIRSVAKLCWRVLLNLWRWNFLVWPDSPDFLNEKLFSYNLGFYFLHVVFVIGCILEYELVHIAGVEAAVKYVQGAIVCKADAEIPPVKVGMCYMYLFKL